MSGEEGVQRLRTLLASAKDTKFLAQRLQEDLDLLILHQQARKLAAEYHNKPKL